MSWQILFWISIALVAYAYVLFPLLCALLAKTFGKSPRSFDDFTPALTVIVASYNEEAKIATRVADILQQDYPADRLQVLVVCDGCSDQTAVRAKIDPRVRVLELPNNQGKAAALNAAMKTVTTDFVAFTDSRQRFAQGSLRALIAAFADESVGAVTGELVIGNADQSTNAAGEGVGLYWRMEKRLRSDEAALNWLHGVSGACYALRKSCYRDMPAGTILDDMWVPIHTRFAGYRVWMARNAIAYDVASARADEEFHRKLRTLAGNWQLMIRAPRIINPFANPVFFAWFSHKFCRLLVPWCLLLALLTPLFIQQPIYWLAWFAQLAGYSIAGLTLLRPGLTSKIPMASAAGAFVMLNLAALLSLPAYLFRPPQQLWKKH